MEQQLQPNRTVPAPVIAINGRLVKEEEAMISVRDPGLLRGDGVFEVVRLYDGRPFALDEHLDRLSRSARAIELDVDLELLRTEVDEVVASVPRVDRQIRIVVTRLNTRIVLVEPLVVLPDWITLMPVEHEVSPLLAGVKSLSYAANVHARRKAQAHGCDDALLYSARTGLVLEGPMVSFCWVQDGELRSPPLSGGILDSITRRALCAAVRVAEVDCRVTDLAHAEEACVLGTSFELVRVKEVRGIRTFDTNTPVLDRAATALSGEIARRLGRDAAESVDDPGRRSHARSRRA